MPVEASSYFVARVIRRILQLSVAAVLVLAVGGHWMLLQSFAWVRMTVNFSQTAPLEEALRKTFNGEHPCALCKAVQNGKQSEKETDRRALDKKIDLFCPRSEFHIVHPVKRPPVLVAFQDLSSRAEAPPRPPPKAS